MNLNKEVLRIQQIINEENYSKRNINDYLMFKTNGLTTIRHRLIDKISTYLQGQYWPSKNDYITAINISDVSVIDIAEELLLLMAKYRETSIQNVANDIGNLFNNIDDVFVRVQIGSDILAACQNIGYTLTKLEEGILFTSTIKISRETELRLAKFIYQPPLKCKPNHINNNFQSGYLTWDDSVVIGGKDKQHNKPLRLDVINILNNIGFVLDKETCKKVHKPKNKLKGDDLKNWNKKMKETSSIVKEYEDTEFYFNWKLDSRQRMYCQGYHLSTQGDEYQKASINLAKYELCSS